MLMVSTLLTAAAQQRHNNLKMKNDLLEASALIQHKMSPAQRVSEGRKNQEKNQEWRRITISLYLPPSYSYPSLTTFLAISCCSVT